MRICAFLLPVTTSSFAKSLSDLTLRRFCRGDRSAFEQVYRTWSQPVFTLALRITGSPEAARDVLQDAMLKAWDRARSFRGDAPFWGWLRQIAVNEALMHLRHRQVHDHESIDALVEADSDTPEPWRHADAQQLECALAALEPMARTVLWLHVMEGMSHVEIAAHFGRSESFSKSQFARARQRLRACLQPESEETPCPTTLCG